MKVVHAGIWLILKDDGTIAPLNEGRAYRICKTTENPRTAKQNAAMHKYFSLVAESLNDGGYSVAQVLNYKATRRVEAAFEFLSEKLTAAKKLLSKVGSRVLADDEHVIPWPMLQVKENLWKPIMKALYGYDSTTSLKPNEVTEVHRVLQSILAQRYGINVPFPSEEELFFERKLDAGQ